jgi:hypothetical protein
LDCFAPLAMTSNLNLPVSHETGRRGPYAEMILV